MTKRFFLGGILAVLVSAGCSSTNAPASDTSTQAPEPHASRHHHHRRRGASSPAPDSDVAASTTAVATSAGSFPCNDAGFLNDRQQFSSGALTGDQAVDVCGTVTRVLPERDTRSGNHGYYDVSVGSGVTIEIVCNLDEMDAPAWPWVAVGNYSYVQGRYYYDSTGSQGIDWTHHGTSREWPTAGYVVVDGKQYQ